MHTRWRPPGRSGVAAAVSWGAATLREGSGADPLRQHPWSGPAGAAAALVGAAVIASSGKLEAGEAARRAHARLLARRASLNGVGAWRGFAGPGPARFAGGGCARAARGALAVAAGGGSGCLTRPLHRITTPGESRWRQSEGTIPEDAVTTLAEAADAAAAAEAGAGLQAPLLTPAGDDFGAAAGHSTRFKRRHGWGLAVASGLFGGAALLPLDWAPFECRGLPWVPAMAVGVAATAPAVTWGMHLLTTRKVRRACGSRGPGCLWRGGVVSLARTPSAVRGASLHPI